HSPDVLVFDQRVRHPRISEPNDGHGVVLTGTVDESSNACGILIEDRILGFFRGRLQNAFVGHCQGDDDITGIHGRQITSVSGGLANVSESRSPFSSAINTWDAGDARSTPTPL